MKASFLSHLRNRHFAAESHSRALVHPAQFFSCLFLTLCFISPSPLSSQVQWTPVAKLELLGGQFFFEGERTSFSGNGNWLLTPGIKFSENFLLVPTVTGKYRRVREVKELIGGGFLTREELENTAIVKGIYAAGENWKMKLKGSFKNQLLVESKDEKLGKGLFDNNKLGFGWEMERTGTILKSFRFSFDPYGVRFLRYKTLASGSQFGSEIKSGENTLDFNGYDSTLALEMKLSEKALLSGMFLGSYRLFTEQKVITTSGLFTDKNRKDFSGQLNLGGSYRLPDSAKLKLQSLAGLEFSVSFLDSNQNNYDATRTRFNQDFYDYLEFHLSPRMVGRVFGKLDWALVYDFTRRNYTQRVVQKTDGTYGTDKINLNTHTFSYSFKYPLPYRLSLIAQGVYRRSTSNMKFERTYRYSYTAQHYFLGISWEY